MAAWGVDLVKLDWCFMPPRPVFLNSRVRVYAEMRDALRASGRRTASASANGATGGGGRGARRQGTCGAPRTTSRRTTAAIAGAPCRASSRATRGSPVTPGRAAGTTGILQVGLRGLSATEGRTMSPLWAMMAALLLAPGTTCVAWTGRPARRCGNREADRCRPGPGRRTGPRVSAKRGRDVLHLPLSGGDGAAPSVGSGTSRTRLFLRSPSAMFGGDSGTHSSVRDLWNGRTRSPSPPP